MKKKMRIGERKMMKGEEKEEGEVSVLFSAFSLSSKNRKKCEFAKCRIKMVETSAFIVHIL